MQKALGRDGKIATEEELAVIFGKDGELAAAARRVVIGRCTIRSMDAATLDAATLDAATLYMVLALPNKRAARESRPFRLAGPAA